MRFRAGFSGVKSRVDRTMTTALANPNKALWEKEDFTRIADTMRESGVELVKRIGVTPGLKVLGLGCGDGTTAIPAARLGADVLGATSRGTWSRPGTGKQPEATACSPPSYACPQQNLSRSSFFR